MTTEEKIKLIEKTLQEKANSLTEDTKLGNLKSWDSLNILNLQIERSVFEPDLQCEALYTCETVGDICAMI
jgi:acyl carrier protein